MTEAARQSSDGVLDGLSDDQREWALKSEGRWRRAYALAERFTDSDVSDLYHALRCLELSPTERLAAGLQRGRAASSRRPCE